jgi:thiol-disulfide isomerase/thioredoxin
MNTKLKFLLFGLFIGLVSSFCVKAESTGPIKPIYIVFDSIKSNYDTLSFKDGAEFTTTNPALSVRLSPTQSKSLSVKNTIEIQPELGYIIVKHKYCPTSSVEFILKAGDVAHIKYINEVPFVNVTNRDVKSLDVNYDYFKRLRYPRVEDMQSIDIVNNPSVLTHKKLLKGQKSSSLKVLAEFQPILLNELKDENLWLDSIYQSKQISEKEYQFYKNRNNYLSLDLNLKAKTANELTCCLKEYNDSLYINDVAGFYRNHFYWVGISYLDTIVPSLKGNKQTGSYDIIERSNFVRGKLSQDLRLKCLLDIINTSPAPVRRTYFNKFASSVSDTALVAGLKRHYSNLLDPNITNSLDVELLDIQGQKTTLASVLKQCTGKTIYVDFWASWCAPCLQEMPISKQLRNNASYKNVVFIYLALNDREDQWKLAWKKADLENYPHNYLILNSKDASFIKQFKISSIPRYMVFDKKGKLLNSDAPRPSDNKIHVILTAY